MPSDLSKFPAFYRDIVARIQADWKKLHDNRPDHENE